MPLQAIWNNTIIAHSADYKILEGQYYFPPESIRKEHLQKNGNQYMCRWKGTADYYDVVVDEKVNKDAAWTYPHPDAEAKGIQGYFSFWNGVDIIKTDDDGAATA